MLRAADVSRRKRLCKHAVSVRQAVPAGRQGPGKSVSVLPTSSFLNTSTEGLMSERSEAGLGQST